jgi:hypothetical protein
MLASHVGMKSAQVATDQRVQSSDPSNRRRPSD